MANDLSARLDAALAFDAPSRHSLFQLKHFILGKEVSVNGRIWQCLRELRVRKDSLDAVALEIEAATDKLAMAEIQERNTLRAARYSQPTKVDIPMPENEIEERAKDEKRILILNHKAALREVTAAKQTLAALDQKKKDLEVEAAFFVEEFEKLTAHNPVKSLDDEDAQKEYWTAKLFQEVHIKSLLGQPLEPELVKTVLSMPDESPVKAQMVAFLNTIRDAKVKAVSASDNTAALTK